jgi:hypothetical protein
VVRGGFQPACSACVPYGDGADSNTNPDLNGLLDSTGNQLLHGHVNIHNRAKPIARALETLLI